MVGVLLSLVALHTAEAADGYRKWQCRGEDKRTLRVPRSCESEFRTYARDLHVGVGAAVGPGAVAGDLSVRSSAVELALDAINKDLRTNYVALCMGWASPDPCDRGAIQRYDEGRAKLAEGASALRLALAGAGDDPEEIERVLLAIRSSEQRGQDLLVRLDEIVTALKDGAASPTASGGITSGRWLATFTYRSGSRCLPDDNFSRELRTIAMGDEVQVDIVGSDGLHYALTGSPEVDGWSLRSLGGGVYRTMKLMQARDGLEGEVEVHDPGLMMSCDGVYGLRASRVE